MKDYFEFEFKFVENKPVFKISLKNQFKKNTAALRESGYPYSGVEYSYYEHHVDDKDLAKSLWVFRKSLCNYEFLIEYLHSNKVLSENDFEKCKFWSESVKIKTKDNHLKAMQSESARENMSKAGKRNAHLSSDRLKNLWKTNGKKLRAALFNDEVKQRRVTNFKKYLSNTDNYSSYLASMRNPERVEKISKEAKKMWKVSSIDVVNRMRNNWTKKFLYSGKKMNSIEFKVATILDSLHVSWEYEPVIRYENGFLQPDFVINNSHVIECFGNFWHAHHDLYDDEEILFSTRTASKQRDLDKQRIDKLNQCFKSVTVLWENEILNESINEKLENLIHGMD